MFKRGYGLAKRSAQAAGLYVLSRNKSKGKGVSSKVIRKYKKKRSRKRSGYGMSMTRAGPKKRGNANDVHSGISSRNYTIVINPKIPKHDIGHWEYTQTHSDIMTIGAGLQSTTNVAGIAYNAQILNSTGAAYTYRENSVALQELNPYLTNTGSNYFSSVVKPLTNKFVIGKVHFTMELTNLSTNPAVVDIYFFAKKKSVFNEPLFTWGEALANTALGKTSMVYPVAGSATGSSGFGTITEPWARPTDLRQFNEVFKTVKHVAFDLGAASNEVLSFNILLNKMIKCDVVQQQFNSGQFLAPGIGLTVIAIGRGSPVVDTTGTARMTYGSGQIGWVARTKYTMHSVSGNAGRLDLSIHHSNIPIGATLANQKQVDIDDTIAAVERVIT